MSALSELQHQLQLYGEVENIITAMRNLAFIEMNKLNRLMPDHDKAASSAFMMYRMSPLWDMMHKSLASPKLQRIVLMIGTERGFCGGINEQLVHHWQALSNQYSIHVTCCVGQRLITRMEKKYPEAIPINGVHLAEEVSIVRDTIYQQLSHYLTLDAPIEWIWIAPANQTWIHRPLSEISTDKNLPISNDCKPLLMVPPYEFASAVLQQYFQVELHVTLMHAFLYENKMRFQHMEGARQHLLKQQSLLKSKINSLRQELITEELELLSSNF